MARARNNIARLPFEQRMVVAEMLADGATYDEIRSAVSSDKELHNRSFLAYQDSAEFKDVKTSIMQQRKRFAKKKIDAARIAAEHGVESVIGITEAVLVEQLQEFLSEDFDADISDMSKAAGILANLKKSQAEEVKRAAAEKEAAFQAEIARLTALVTEQAERIKELSAKAGSVGAENVINEVDKWVKGE